VERESEGVDERNGFFVTGGGGDMLSLIELNSEKMAMFFRLSICFVRHALLAAESFFLLSSRLVTVSSSTKTSLSRWTDGDLAD
jgi:hypothetical protein